MKNGDLTMSQKEADRLSLINQVISKKITAKESSVLLRISERQVFRLLCRVREEGSKGIIHKLRGKKSNRGYTEELKKKVIGIYKNQYSDYGPTLFSEELLKNHSISLDHETVRRWMRESFIATSERKKRPHRRRRERRSAFGEMIQFDGSHHDWFEGRGAKSCLYVCVDDSTGKVYLHFGRTENTADAMLTIWEYVNQNGIPRSIYLDRFSAYYAKEKLTDFSRAMKEMEVEVIYAKSPQAKGRVENRNRTLQDRLVKAMRQRGISTTADANEYLRNEFTAEFNSKFAVNLEAPDVHKSADGYQLEEILCYKTTRQVRNDYTINLAGGYVQLLKSESPLPKPRQDVMLHRHLSGELYIYFNDQKLGYEILTGKKAKQPYKFRKLPKDHPWRNMNNQIPGSKKLYLSTST
jgi:transposase-like protein